MPQCSTAMSTSWASSSPSSQLAWAAHFFYDYYLHTGDQKFLRERALPFMEQAALFFEDYLYEGPDGKFIFSPTQSPENWPEVDNSRDRIPVNPALADLLRLRRDKAGA